MSNIFTIHDDDLVCKGFISSRRKYFFTHANLYLSGTANHFQEFLIDRLFSRNNFCILCKGLNSALSGEPWNDTL